MKIIIFLGCFFGTLLSMESKEKIEQWLISFNERPLVEGALLLVCAHKLGNVPPQALSEYFVKVYGRDAIEQEILYAANIGMISILNSLLFMAHAIGVECFLKAALAGNIKPVSALLQAGMNVNCADAGHRTALSIAAEAGHKDIVRLLLDDYKAAVDDRCTEGKTPLLYATGGHHVEIMKLLLGAGADIHTKAPEGLNLFFSAVCGGSLEALQFLQRHGIDIHQKSPAGFNGITYARLFKHESIEKYLLAQGVQPEHNGIKIVNTFGFEVQSNNRVDQLCCSVCHTQEQPLKKCSGCSQVYYCSTVCQHNDWKEHKKVCKRNGQSVGNGKCH